MAKKEKSICKNCFFWRRDWLWDKKMSKVDRRKIGNCYRHPPTLAQNLLPFYIREHGLNNIKNKMLEFQIRPTTEHDDYCGEWREK